MNIVYNDADSDVLSFTIRRDLVDPDRVSSGISLARLHLSADINPLNPSTSTLKFFKKEDGEIKTVTLTSLDDIDGQINRGLQTSDWKTDYDHLVGKEEFDIMRWAEQASQPAGQPGGADGQTGQAGLACLPDTYFMRYTYTGGVEKLLENGVPVSRIGCEIFRFTYKPTELHLNVFPNFIPWDDEKEIHVFIANIHIPMLLVPGYSSLEYGIC